VFLMGAIFGLISAVPVWVVFFSFRERKQFITQEQPSLRDSIRAAAKNRPFIFGAVIFLLTWVSVEILNVGLLYYIKYVVQRETQSDLFMATIFITAILALPLWNWVSRRWNKRIAYVVGIAFWAIVQLVLITLNAGTSVAFVLALCVFAGVGVGAAHVLPWSILPDAVEWDEWQTGKRHEGMFYSLVTLAQKIASSIAIPLTLLVLDLTGYVPNAAVQKESAITGIRLVLGPIPALLLFGGILFALLYPLSRDQFKKVVGDLEERRALGAQAGKEG
jgi:Na+/melibiose symporter-like transporter